MVVERRGVKMEDAAIIDRTMPKAPRRNVDWMSCRERLVALPVVDDADDGRFLLLISCCCGFSCLLVVSRLPYMLLRLPLSAVIIRLLSFVVVDNAATFRDYGMVLYCGITKEDQSKDLSRRAG